MCVWVSRVRGGGGWLGGGGGGAWAGWGVVVELLEGGLWWGALLGGSVKTRAHIFKNIPGEPYPFATTATGP